MENLNSYKTVELTKDELLQCNGGESGDFLKAVGYVFGWISGKLRSALEDTDETIVIVGTTNPVGTWN
jgi:hypothetical protein